MRPHALFGGLVVRISLFTGMLDMRMDSCLCRKRQGVKVVLAMLIAANAVNIYVTNNNFFILFFYVE